MRRFIRNEIQKPVKVKSITRAFQSKQEHFGVKTVFNIHRYSTRTQVMNSMLLNHNFTKEEHEVMNKRTLKHFNLIVKSTFYSHLAGMSKQGATIIIDGVSYGKGFFTSAIYKGASFKSVITMRIDDEKWVARIS